MHQLLPWYANRTLSTEQAAAFREHLSSCADCRAEMEVVGKLRDLVAVNGAAFLAEHPSAELLVDVVMGEVREAEQVARVRQHLALCSACADEARWVVEDTATARLEQPPRRWVGRLGWTLAAAAVLGGVAFGLATLRSPAGPDVRVGRPAYVRPATRAAGADNVFVLARGATHVDLVFEIDFAPESFPARLELLTADGKRLHVEERIEREMLLDASFLFLDCPRSTCAPGRYVVVIESAGGKESELRFAFSVVER